MQMPPDNIITNKNWGFEVKIKNNSIVLEFDRFDGTRNQASPAHLIALLLKKHLKAIEKENGTKVGKIGFYLFDNFKAEATERVKLQLTEAATLAKINCCFVDSDI
uniref:Uncharacterized protein n=1 Tax=Panagrolaimus sp. PS1159 TaxID=55785 RepID=A0AC35GTC1_9BILA